MLFKSGKLCYDTLFIFPNEFIMSDLSKEISCRWLDTLSGSNQEKVRQKKKRIETHFQKMENITSAAFTIASEESRETTLGAYFLRLNGIVPFKPFPMASEGYCLDSIHAHILSPVLYALATVYSLDLSHVSISLHFTSVRAMERCQLLLEGKASPKDSIEEAVCFLCSPLKVTIVPCLKGPFF